VVELEVLLYAGQLPPGDGSNVVAAYMANPATWAPPRGTVSGVQFAVLPKCIKVNSAFLCPRPGLSEDLAALHASGSISADPDPLRCCSTCCRRRVSRPV